MNRPMSMFGDGHAKIGLLGPGSLPELVWCEGMERGEVRKAMKIVTERRSDLLVRWRKIHG